ncbi:MAG: polyprenyl synthetase family protein [Verrucomicrobiota bacterium]
MSASATVTPPPVQLTLPRPVPQQRFRTPKKNIPQTPQERNRVLLAARAYVEREKPVPPLPQDELAKHADALVAKLEIDPIYRDYVGVLINNELWRETLASVPYERRLLLIPKCLRIESKCPAPFDEFGLLCKQCGLCSIQDLQLEAERLGYAVLVAEGSAIVMSLIQTGKIEAIVGVSCLSVLERAFPYMEAAAVPGVAVPLLQDDCIDTTVDLDWVWDYIHLTSDDRTRRMDLGALREEVDFWFTPLSLDSVMGPAVGEPELIAREWLQRAGKRWRPFLTVAAYQALQDEPGAAVPDSLKKIAVAVECFHKASLIHDDIEDGDESRYGEPTLHAEHGVAVALNVGDLLIGEGYRLLAESAFGAEERAMMLQVASRGQRELCRGQGAELAWTKSPRPLTSVEVMEIFERKTAPAFDVALQIGALAAGLDAHEEVTSILATYSRAMGIAYQIRDDLEDYSEGGAGAPDDVAGMRPSVVLSAGWERAQGESKKVLEACWKRESGVSPEAVRAACVESGALDRSQDLLERYKEEAIRSLGELENASLKGLLRRVLGKIFNDTEIKGWCKEFENKEAHAE